MPYQHNKKQDRKPTKRTDRPARRTATHGTKRETTRSNAPHMRGAGANTKVHQEQHRVMPPTTHAAYPPYQMRNSKRHLPVWIAFALIALIAVAFAFSSCTSCSSGESNNEGTLAAPDKAASEGQTITLSFAGDCTLGTDEGFDRSTSFNAKYNEVGDPAYFFANVASIFADDDATIVNMEGTLTDSTTRADKTFAFKAPREYAEILKAGNVGAASLANNHSRDYGDQSYTDTIEAVEAVGIPTFGYDRIAYLDVKGVKVALVGTYELAEGAGIKDEMVSNINAAKEAGARSSSCSSTGEPSARLCPTAFRWSSDMPPSMLEQRSWSDRTRM